jgi:hypothetical protein
VNNSIARLLAAPSHVVSSLRRARPPRTVPAAVLPGSETIHLGGGEMIPCPGIESVPISAAARHLGLGSPSLALPPSKIHVLKNAVLAPGSRVVRTTDGRIVSESITTDMAGRVPLGDVEHGSRPVEIPGAIALYRSPWQTRYHLLVDQLPRAALLSQPAVRRLGPLTLVHDGPLDPMEQLLLPRLLGRAVELRQVEPWTTLTAERILLPGYVTRPAAGAIPSWYRRWVDRTAASLGSSVGGSRPPRRFFIDPSDDSRSVQNRDALDAVLRDRRVETLSISGMSAAEQIRCFRDAELVVAVSGSGLVDVLFSRAAHVVELVPGHELYPHFLYLCASKGLPYDYVLPPGNAERDHGERRRHGAVVDVAALDRLLAGMERGSD